MESKKHQKIQKKLRFASPVSEDHLPDLTKGRWVEQLTNEHREKIISNQPLCSDILNHIQRLYSVKKQFPDIKGLQPTEKTPVWDEANSKWIYNFPFQKTMSPAAQIHHNGKFHWVLR